MLWMPAKTMSMEWMPAWRSARILADDFGAAAAEILDVDAVSRLEGRRQNSAKFLARRAGNNDFAFCPCGGERLFPGLLPRAVLRHGADRHERNQRHQGKKFLHCFLPPESRGVCRHHCVVGSARRCRLSVCRPALSGGRLQFVLGATVRGRPIISFITADVDHLVLRGVADEPHRFAALLHDLDLLLQHPP